MQDIKFLCKTCGHPKKEHDKKCGFKNKKYDRICPCGQYDEVQITNKMELLNEYREARKEYEQFMKLGRRTKHNANINPVSDKVFLIYERQKYLSKVNMET